VFADLNLGPKLTSPFLKKRHYQISFAENIELFSRLKDDATLENKLNANGVSFYKLELLRLMKLLDLGHLTFDIKSTEISGSRLRFIRPNNLKRNGASAFDNYKTNLYFTFLHILQERNP
jgi:phosphoribosylformylglycinamidine synthase